ncbi:MAG: hypothetical protein WC986_14635 [Elusimicrobiota bacterium]|jgi:hypothetical protein
MKPSKDEQLTTARREMLALWLLLTNSMERLRTLKVKAPVGSLPLCALAGQMRAMKILADDLHRKLEDYGFSIEDSDFRLVLTRVSK